jgi:hypothetical protein
LTCRLAFLILFHGQVNERQLEPSQTGPCRRGLGGA